MSAQRVHESNAKRQAAYRWRCWQEQDCNSHRQGTAATSERS
jgi:hypothetical protein